MVEEKDKRHTFAAPFGGKEKVEVTGEIEERGRREKRKIFF